MFLEQAHRQQQQVVEVGAVLRAQLLLVFPVDLRQAGPLRGAAVLEQLLRPPQAVLRRRDDGLHLPHARQFVGPAPSAQQLAQHGEGVFLVKDGDRTPETEPFGVASQQPQADRVEGPDPQPGHVALEHAGDAPLHLVRGLVREGDGQDAIERDPFPLHEPDHAMGEHARLPAAGPREHEQRPRPVQDGRALIRIQGSEDRILLRDVLTVRHSADSTPAAASPGSRFPPHRGFAGPPRRRRGEDRGAGGRQASVKPTGVRRQ